MLETGQAIVLTLAGFALLLPLGHRIPKPAALALSFPVGALGYLAVCLVMLATTGRVFATYALIAVALGGAIAVWSARELVDGNVVKWAAGLAAIAAAVGLAAWFAPVARLTPDSGVYLLNAHQIQLPHGSDILGGRLVTRQMGMAALHALAVSGPRAYVAFVGPMFGLSAVGLFAWFCWDRLRVATARRAVLVAASVVFLLTSNRFLYDFFYINAHIEMAAYLVMAAIGCWLALAEEEPSWALIGGIGLSGIMLFRPEAPLLALLFIVPFAAASTSVEARRLLALPPMVTVFVWYGLVMWPSVPGGGRIGLTEPVFGSLAVMAGAGVIALGLERWPRLARLAGTALVPALVAVLALYAIDDVSILGESIEFTAKNTLFQGFWLSTWAILVPLLGIALLVHRIPHGQMWTRPILGFGVLFFILPYVRNSAWRLGEGDSGNRMLAHVLLIVLAFVLLTFVGDRSEADALVPESRR